MDSETQVPRQSCPHCLAYLCAELPTYPRRLPGRYFLTEAAGPLHTPKPQLSLSAGFREAALAGSNSGSQWVAKPVAKVTVNLIWRHGADPAFTSENPGKRQPQL